MDSAIGWLIAIVAVVAIVVFVIVYIILPLVAIIASAGLIYGGYIAIKNYAEAFNDVTIKGNRGSR